MGQYCFARGRLSSSVTLPAGGRAGWPPGAWVVGRPTLHGGPVRLRPVRATPCYRRSSVIRLSICLLATFVSPVNTAEPIKTPIGGRLGWAQLKPFI